MAAKCQIRLDFFTAKAPVYTRGKEFLAYELDQYLAWGKKHRVPLYLGEFGSIRQSFDEDRGGIRWVEDMLDLWIERDLHFAYHAYHEEHFSIFYGDGKLPDLSHADTALLDLFRKKLAR